MKNSKNIAALLGPTLMALTASEMINAHIWINVLPAQTYLAGALWFVAGLSIVRVHNYWAFAWPVLITILGWFTVLGGLSRMFFPVTVQQGSQNATVIISMQIVLLVIGIILTYKAYIREKS